MAAGDGRRDAWTLLTSHGHVLVEIARDPQARIRELSAAAGITERATAAIVADLVAAGYVTRSRVGRRNHYAVNLDLGFRHTAQRDLRVGPFLALLSGQPFAETAVDRDKSLKDV
ncbi:DNA-binding MarR family transcriptional regulator [Catenulispora sp. MAP12-49]|uniref:helix-turn-helix transcriptional regulator n=1 Tax=unclassified Catenulispora TaxID=414885 RepID=UPI003515DE83